MKLPKNFRQIGEASLDTKIYIEDYVMTYLSEITRDSKTYVRGAILFGTIEKRKKETFVFVSGAMAAQNIELDLDETVFDDLVWKKIYETKEEYFKDTQVVGWYLCRTGMSIRLNDKIKKTHFENFPGDGKILYMADPLEEEEAMYVYRGQDLVRQPGYYVYFVKNKEMQSYLIEVKKEQEAALTYERMVAMHRDERIVRQSRTKMKRKKRQNKGLVSRAVTAASFMFLFGAVGTYVLFSKTKLPSVAVSAWSDAVNSIHTSSESSEKESDAQKETWTKVFSIDDSASSKEEKTKETKTDTKEKKTKQGEKEKKESDSKKQETMAQSSGTFYTIQKGDTITRISRKLFGSNHYVDAIMKENGLTSKDSIYPGQKLKIPKIQDPH